MYLEERHYIGAEFEDREVEGTVDISIRGEPLDVKLSDISTIVCKVAYWRKANAIHAWFVDNVMGGEDDCAEHWVGTHQLGELLDICKKVSADHSLAEELLPTRGGFFFGTTEYDEWYFKDIDETIEILEALPLDDEEAMAKRGDFYYRASW